MRAAATCRHGASHREQSASSMSREPARTTTRAPSSRAKSFAGVRLSSRSLVERARPGASSPLKTDSRSEAEIVSKVLLGNIALSLQGQLSAPTGPDFTERSHYRRDWRFAIGDWQEELLGQNQLFQLLPRERLLGEQDVSEGLAGLLRLAKAFAKLVLGDPLARDGEGPDRPVAGRGESLAQAVQDPGIRFRHPSLLRDA